MSVSKIGLRREEVARGLHGWLFFHEDPCEQGVPWNSLQNLINSRTTQVKCSMVMPGEAFVCAASLCFAGTVLRNRKQIETPTVSKRLLAFVGIRGISMYTTRFQTHEDM